MKQGNATSGVARNFKRREESIYCKSHRKSLEFFSHSAIFLSFYQKAKSKGVGGMAQCPPKEVSECSFGQNSLPITVNPDRCETFTNALAA